MNKYLKFFFLPLLLAFVSINLFAQNPTNKQIVLQAFWWDYWNTNYPNGWSNYLSDLAPRLKDLGIDAVWIPNTVKGENRGNGYNPFDHYDLGDKYQKGNVKTRMGDKDELLRMISVYKANGIDIVHDMVFNHVSGAGANNGFGGQDPQAIDDGSTNRYKNFRYTSYDFPETTPNNYLERNGRFPKNWQNFYPNPFNSCCTNDINSPFWGPDISYESNAFGLSSNAVFNPIQSTDYMRSQMRFWAIWHKKQTGVDGYRFDAVKHFPTYVAEDILWNLQFNAGFASGGNSMFTVGEWVGGASDLDNWCNAVQNRAGTFDFGLRSAIYSAVVQGGNYNMGNIPSSQQSNRQRTVPFVNNHDTFRPQVNNVGNYTGWNTQSELAPHIEPNDPRMPLAYAIAFAVDGSPQVFFEDLFDVGYTSKRFSHLPTNINDLPVREDLVNLIWCHQNLNFAGGSYLVRWQAPDLLIIERSAKAVICLTDNWNNWQNATAVQTSFTDGTVLKDYTGANGNATRTVYNGGKVDLSAPPCNGTAPRRGYSIWAPVGIVQNYTRPDKTVTQEWEMANDLGDSHPLSLRQGGQLPPNSLDCRLVGMIFPEANLPIDIYSYPLDTNQNYKVLLVNEQCVTIDSVVGRGILNLKSVATRANWHAIKVQNADTTNFGQKLYVKIEYTGDKNVNTRQFYKPTCSCIYKATPQNSNFDFEPSQDLVLFPNPVNSTLFVQSFQPLLNEIEVKSITGQSIFKTQNVYSSSIEIDTQLWSNGIYILVAKYENFSIFKKFSVQN